LASPFIKSSAIARSLFSLRIGIMLILLNNFGFASKHDSNDDRADDYTNEQASMC